MAKSLRKIRTSTYQTEQQRLELDARVAALEDMQRLNEATIDYFCNFIDVPAKMWRDADFSKKLEFQRMILPERTIFDVKAQGFGTKGLSPLYRLNPNKKDLSVTEKSHLVNLRCPEAKLFWEDLYKLSANLEKIGTDYWT